MVRRCHMLIAVVLVALVTTAVAPALAQSETKPVQLALVTPIQIFNEQTAIKGVRLNLIYGRNVALTGLDIGLVNHTTTGPFQGVQWGLAGIADGSFTGAQWNAVNIVYDDFEGFQWGLVNYANHANGFMLGFVNYAVTARGLQIGLINIIKQGGAFPVFPIVNWSF